MSYIPKSKISYKNAPEGKFIYKNTKKPFSGPYISVKGEQYYEGVNFLNKGPELILLFNINTNNAEKRFNTHKDIRSYNNIKKSIANRLIKAKPLPVAKSIPQKQDYDLGYYIRYFTKKFNNNSFLEIDKNTYDKLKNKSPQYDFNLYECGNIKWYLKGNVFKLNALSIERTNREFPQIFVLFPILNEFFQPTVSVLENQNTNGKELYYSDGTEYIGLYHIHPIKGPMVGGTHTSSPHKNLYYTNQLPNIGGDGYESFLQNYNKIKCYKCINEFGKFKKVISSTRSSLLGCPKNTTPDYDIAAKDCEYLRENVDEKVVRSIANSSSNLKRVFPLDGGTPSSKDYSGFGLWNKNNKQYGAYNNENGNCFTPNTLITMADGTEKLISQITKGEKVKSQVGESKVLEVITYTGSFTAYSINGSKPFTTEEHPFKTIDGWKAINPITTLEKHQIQSKTLDLNDVLIKQNGKELVISIEKGKTEYPKVYNLSLDNEHVYYANKYLVHNEKQIGLSIDDLEEMAFNSTPSSDFTTFIGGNTSNTSNTSNSSISISREFSGGGGGGY